MSVGGGRGGERAPIRLSRTWDDEREMDNMGTSAHLFDHLGEREVS